MLESVPTSPVREHLNEETHETHWTIETKDLALTLTRLATGDVRLTSMRTAGREWIATPVPMFTLANELSRELVFRDAAVKAEGNTLHLRGTLDPLHLTLSMTWTVYEESSVVTTAIDVANETGQSIELGPLASLRFLATDDRAQIGLLAGGRWDEALPPRGYRLQTWDLHELRGTTSFGAAEDGRSSGEQLPWFTLLSQGGGLLASLAWSGRWRLNIRHEDRAASLVLGISDFSRLLQPGDHVTLPGVVLAGFASDLDDGANTWRDWVVRHWMPAVPEGWPWVQYNHWYAYYGDIDAGRLLEEARQAVDIGCEVFVIDDGWFRGRRPDSYFAGWGDWVEDRSKFPEGLRAFGDQIRALGMKFGLWVEPERADPEADLLQAHPDWAAIRDGAPISRPGSAGAEGVHLCLGNPEVQQWMAADMIRVVQDYGVDWLKWDYNIGYGLGCNTGSHGHQATDGHHAHTLGLYSVLDQLRAACPDLVIENCASGGHRVDLGTLRHTHTNWISDYTHRAASCRQHVQGAGLFLPLQHLNTWVLEDRTPTGFRSRMGGALGVSSFMEQWSGEERQIAREAIDEYKQLRPFLGGQRFLLTGPLHQDWEIWQFLHPSREEFALLAFREGGHISEVRVQPRVPSEHRSYRIQHTGADHAVIIKGAELAGAGITLCLPAEHSSEIVWATAVS